MPTITVLDSTMYFEDAGAGVPLVFLHGNPGSSYLWRRVLPHLGTPGRVLAPDLIGMGRSGKPDIGYTFDDHARYLDAWFDALGLDDVVLVGHDWGGALAFDRAARHPGHVRAVAFLETILRPMSWSAFPAAGRARFAALRTPGVGETMVLERNEFLDAAYTQAVRTPLAAADLDVYRAPYPTPASRRPMLAWPRAMPLDGEPADVVARIRAYDDWLAASVDVPKLLMTFDSSPTLMIDAAAVDWCAANIAALEIVACGPAGHHAPEDQPGAIAAAVASWLDRHRLRVPAPTPVAG